MLNLKKLAETVGRPLEVIIAEALQDDVTTTSQLVDDNRTEGEEATVDPSMTSIAVPCRRWRRTRGPLDDDAAGFYAARMVTRTLQLQDDVNAALEREARGSGRSVDDVLNAVLRHYEERRRAVDEGLADVAAGHVVSNASMKSWLSTWGTEAEGEPPACPE
jgi:predicted transcriptional regulator